MPKPKAPASAPPLTPPRSAAVNAVLYAATLAVLALVLVQCVVAISPDVYWDVDPRSELGKSPITVLTPTAVAWLNAASVVVAAVAVAAHVASGGAVSWVSFILAACGMAACVYHMPRDAESLWRCSIWLAAVSLGLATLHLAQHERLRRYIVAAFIAILIPLALQATWFIWVDSPETIQRYHDTKADTLAGHGWSLGSPQELIFERRLMSPEAAGAFGLSNVFGSIAASATLLSAGACVGLIRARRRRPAIVTAIASALGLLAVALTRSKGAVVVLLVGFAVLALAMIFDKLKQPRLRRSLGGVAITLAVFAILAVLARGGKGPPATAEGERSIFFRYQYWHAATDIMRDGGAATWLRGVGPGSFQELYGRYKNPLSPEEVTSTHNVFIDYTVMLGAGGAAWVVMLLLWLFRAGWGALQPEPDEDGAPTPAASSSCK